MGTLNAKRCGFPRETDPYNAVKTVNGEATESTINRFSMRREDIISGVEVKSRNLCSHSF